MGTVVFFIVMSGVTDSLVKGALITLFALICLPE